jgi:hypothetical protein
MIFAGTQVRPALTQKDFKRLEQMSRQDAVALLNSGKFKFSVPDSVLFTSDTILNVAKPADLPGIRHELSVLGLKPSH